MTKCDMGEEGKVTSKSDVEHPAQKIILRQIFKNYKKFIYNCKKVQGINASSDIFSVYQTILIIGISSDHSWYNLLNRRKKHGF